jgi:hypothetical protein
MKTSSAFLKRTGKVLFGLTFALAMVMSSCDSVTGIDPAEAGALAARAASGVGAVIDIDNEQELALIGNDPAYPANGEYVLTADLSLTGWYPICNPYIGSEPFTGTFDGAGHTITVNSFDPDAVYENVYLGIFAVTGGVEADPSISNLTVNLALSPFKTAAAQYVGGVAGYARDTEFSNITVTGSLEVISSGEVLNYNVGGVAGFAASSSFTNVRVEEELDTTLYYSPPGPVAIWRGDDTFRARPVVGVTGQDGLTTGGVVGYVKNSTFKTVTSSVNIDAQTTSASGGSAPLYAGGVAGFADTVTIDGAQSSATIDGDGPGYNTSAGGVAGYILASTVRNSFASGSINLRSLGAAFSWDDSWQNYAGGLVGYAGGTDTASSLIEKSGASGAIYALAPFPYAGGLVGYVYGYNNFTDPAKNGSVIRQSYATGDVTSESQKDPNGVYGDIPYAGGLVGYSSVAGSRIVDSYARGNVAVLTNGTFAWAGGLIGGNANNSVILRVYATGGVKSSTGNLPPLYAPQYADEGPAAGGIAGFNYYSANTSISDSFALNSTVYGNQSAAQNVVHRVAGSLGNTSGYIGLLDNNRANDGMAVGDNWTQEIGLDERDGANTAAKPAQSVFAAQGWTFGSVWDIGSDGYPVLVLP